MRHPLGLIHGRFQVVHNDHLKYLLSGKSLCDHLIIGVTNPTPDLTAAEATDPRRSSSENNPLTFEEREVMIRHALGESGTPLKTFEIIPFPISKPDKLAAVTPKNAIYYLTIYDAWGHEKKARLESLGLTTHVMWEKPVQEKGITGTLVRAAIRDGKDISQLVPPATARLVQKWNLQKRFATSSDPLSGSVSGS